jgi:hypothetical protein
LRAAFAPVGGAGRLQAIGVRDAHLFLVDEASGARWTANAAAFSLGRRGDTLELAANARLEGAQGEAPADLRVTTDARFQSAIVEFGARNVRPRALFSQAALGPFAGLDAPVTATVSVGLDRHDGINRFEGDVSLGRGNADMAGGRFNLAGGRLHGRYDIESDQLIIDQMQLAGSRTRIRGEARLRDVSRILRAAPNEPAAFDIAFPSMTLDVPGVFLAPLNLSDVQLVGAIVSAERTINFTRLHAQTGQGAIEGSGRYYFAPAGADQSLHPGLYLDATIGGALTVQQVMQGWPMTLATGTHGYLAHTLRGGMVTDGRAHIDIRPGDTLPLRNDAINVTFNVTNGEMQFLETMSPVTNVRASGQLQGNSFHMTVSQARMNGIALSNGRIEVPRFHPHEGQFVTIAAHADGEARNVIEVLMQQPLNLRERIPVDPASVSGHAAVNLTLQRPMENEVPFEAWRFRVDGQTQNFAGAMSNRHVALANGQLQVRGDQQSITVSGPIRAGTSNVQIGWTEYLQRHGRASSEYQISGDFDAQDLVRLGYDLAQYASGRVGVTVSGQGRGFDVDQARLEVNLTNAAVHSPWGFWAKPTGQAASARLSINRARDGGLAFNDIDGRGPGTVVQGNVRIARDERIMDVNLSRLSIQGRSNARVTASRGADGGLDVAVRGALFDAAPFMDSDADPQSANASGAGGASDVVRASIIVDALKMRGDVTLSGANVAVVTGRGGLTSLVASGTSPSNKAFSLALGPRPDNPQGRIDFHTDDAGFAVAALTGTPNVVGGAASAEGEWRVGPPNSARFIVRMRDFQVVRLPAMARLLSSAGSLTGLAETLNGDGIGFSSLDAHLTYANNRVSFTEARMTGPSLGLTGSGSYDIRADNLAVDGVVAPSPMLNLSLLGNVPVLGNLLVSRRGEGVIGMTYSINGHAAAPHVFVNPVSALTPGILRRIFEPFAPRQPAAPAPDPAQPPPAVAAPPEAATSAAPPAPLAPEAGPGAAPSR